MLFMTFLLHIILHISLQIFHGGLGWYLYKNIPDSTKNNCSKLSIQFLSILLLMFVVLPVQTVGKNQRVGVFTEYVVSDLNMNEGKKILCFFYIF